VGLRPFARWDYGFESPRRHGCLSVVIVVCCQVEVSASGWSFVQRSPTECGVSECDRETSIMGGPGPLGAVAPWKKEIIQYWNHESAVASVHCARLHELTSRFLCMKWKENETAKCGCA
jgi:hypothetical protein